MRMYIYMIYIYIIYIYTYIYIYIQYIHIRNRKSFKTTKRPNDTLTTKHAITSQINVINENTSSLIHRNRIDLLSTKQRCSKREPKQLVQIPCNH